MGAVQRVVGFQGSSLNRVSLILVMAFFNESTVSFVLLWSAVSHYLLSATVYWNCLIPSKTWVRRLLTSDSFLSSRDPYFLIFITTLFVFFLYSLTSSEIEKLLLIELNTSWHRSLGTSPSFFIFLARCWQRVGGPRKASSGYR